MHTLALLLIGYSLFCALALAATHGLTDTWREQPLSRAMGLVLLGALSGLQVAHLAWLQADLPWVASLPYRLALFTVAPSFYLFARPVLQPTAAPLRGPALWDHALPLLACPLLPAAVAMPAAFVVGAGYLVWLGRGLWALRAERARFHVEMGLLGLAVAIAMGVAALALSPGWWPGLGAPTQPGALASLPHLADPAFVQLYASAIGLALLLVQVTLGLRPALPAVVQEAAFEAAFDAAQSAPAPGGSEAPPGSSPPSGSYSQTTLAKVDCDAALAQLAQLMSTQRLYTDPDLGLASLAQKLGLSGHQLSELLNTRLGKSFARYTRELRVDAARAMLLAEPGASVLSVGLSVGFSAQSNFYDAFREIEGMTPGQYRKLHRPPAAPAS